MTSLRLLLGAALAIALLGATAATAGATYPGKEGRIAFAPGNLRPSNAKLFTILPNGKDRRTLVQGATGARWSANGKVLAYTTGATIFVARADGSDAREVARDQGPFALSPDGRTIVVSRVQEPDPELSTPTDLIAIDVQTGAERRITGQGRNPVFSPTGRWIAFIDVHPGRDARVVSRVKFSGGSRGPLYRTPDTVEALDWSPNGRDLAFVYRNGRYTDLRRLHVSSRKSRRLVRRDSGRAGLFGGLSYSPRGHRLAVGGWDGRRHYELLSVSASSGRVTRFGPKGQAPAWRPLPR